MLHLDLFGPVNVMSIGKKRYTLVIVDEFSRFTWVYFIHRKDETPLRMENKRKSRFYEVIMVQNSKIPQ